MVTRERAINGVVAYMDREIIPHIPGWKAIAVSGVIALYAARAPQILEALQQRPAVQALGVFGEGGQIDVDALYNAFAPKMERPIEIQLPLVGALTFDRAEADKLLQYIKGGI